MAKKVAVLAVPIKYLQWQKRKKSRRIPALPSWQMT